LPSYEAHTTWDAQQNVVRHGLCDVSGDRTTGITASNRERGNHVPTWLLVLIIILVILALFGGFGYHRR
jgi:type VI protein secretion system component VasF